MENDKIYDFNNTMALNAQIKAFNEGYELGRKLAKEEYERE